MLSSQVSNHLGTYGPAGLVQGRPSTASDSASPSRLAACCGHHGWAGLAGAKTHRLHLEDCREGRVAVMSAAPARVHRTLTREGGEGANSSPQSTVLAAACRSAPGVQGLIEGAGVRRLQASGWAGHCVDGSGSPALCFTSRICLYFGHHKRRSFVISDVLQLH